MRILFITYELPPIGGGGGRAAWQVARRLARRGHEVSILTSLFAGLAEYEECERVAIRRIAARRKRVAECPPRELLSFMLRSPCAAGGVAKQSGPDVVCAFFGIPGGPAAWWLRRRYKIPYVLSLRGSDVPRPELAEHQRLHLLTRPILRRIYRNAGGIVSVSGELRDAALRIDPNLPIEVIPNGVDTARFSAKGERNSPGSPPELLFVGRLKVFKGVQYALRALPEIEKRLGSPVRFTVAGDGPYRSTLEAVAQQVCSQFELQSVTRFVGWLDEDAITAAYESASLLLLPSAAEGHPNVLLEGMAMGLPCVGSDAPGTRDIVSADVGILVTPTDTDAIARAVVQVLAHDETWRRMSQSARAKAESFSWDDVAGRYEAILTRAAAARKGALCGT